MATTNHDKVLDRREIAAALLRALERRHEVLDVIVESKDRGDAVAKLASLLDTDEFCAEAVLNLPFRRLTQAERKKIREELDDLDAVLQWTTAGDGPRFGLIVHHTDAAREWAYDRTSPIGTLDKALDEATARGWTVVSMKDYWRAIYPPQK